METLKHGMPFNPNQSLFGIEGITSESGKIFGRMGHPERFADGLFKKSKLYIFRNVRIGKDKSDLFGKTDFYKII